MQTMRESALVCCLIYREHEHPTRQKLSEKKNARYNLRSSFRPAQSAISGDALMPQPASAPFPVGPGANRPRERRRAGRREAALRKHRIFARLAEGRSHAAIAREENCSLQWIRRIIAEALQAREADPFEEFRKLQVARLSLALQVGHQALMEGKLAAIDPYLKTVKALDRYHRSKNGAEHGVGANSSVVSGAARQKSQRN
jgi:hypothetical protein